VQAESLLKRDISIRHIRLRQQQQQQQQQQRSRNIRQMFELSSLDSSWGITSGAVVDHHHHHHHHHHHDWQCKA
jgi:transcription initiation factor TFIID subunit TAF12